jgi:hypothetical protein
MQTDERLAKLEAKAEAIEKEVNEIKFDDIKEIKKMVHDIQTKLNGYLENRIRTILWSTFGKIAISILTSSAVISFVISLLMRR